jgi:hypothetical protein
MQKNDVFFKDFKTSFIVAGLAFTVFFAVAIFCELAMGAIFKIEPSQARISLFVGVFMAIGVGFFLFSKNSLGNKVGGIVETIQGAAGFLTPSQNYFKNLKKRCEEVGALLILDEIQPGFGRTGKLFSFEHYDMVPDILVMGKGMGGGVPVGAFMSSAEIMKSLQHSPKLGHITTFGGNPLIAAASYATLKEVLDSGLMNEVNEKEALFRELLVHPKIKKVNGRGLMLAVELESPDYTLKVAKRCMEKGSGIYYENHHVIPKCKPFNGTNGKENLVLLLPREHFLCHHLLWKNNKNNRSLFLAHYRNSKCFKDRKFSSKQYKKLMAIDDVELEFSDEALSYMADEVIKDGTGARGLRGMLEGIMQDAMYELPSKKGKKKHIITKEMVEKLLVIA